MIVRLMGEGQYRLDDTLTGALNEIDNAAISAIEAGDEAGLQAQLEQLHEIVRAQGERLEDTHLAPSNLIVPPADLTLREAQALFGTEGLIPDLPG